MDGILDKKVMDLSVLETMKYAYLVSVSSNLTMNINEFGKVIGKDKRGVLKLMNARLLPENLIKGGYDYKKENKSPMFITKNVLEWLSN